MTPRLVVLNGPPAVGKSTLAGRYAADHPLTLNLDIDRVRDLIGGWRDDPGAAGLLARAVAVAAARTHLRGGCNDVRDRSRAADGGRVVDPARLGGLPTLRAGTDSVRRAGHDVVVPQLVARPGFLEELESVATSTGAAFYELVLMDDRAAVLRRFADRASTVPDAPQTEPHELAALYDRLTAYLERRPRAVVVPAPAGAVEETYRRVLDQLDTDV